MSAVKSVKLQRPVLISAFDEFSMSEIHSSIGSANEWKIRSGALNIPFKEMLKDGYLKKSNLIYSLDGKFLNKEYVHFGDNNEVLKSSFLYDIFSKTFLCGEESFKTKNKLFCDDEKLPEDKLYIVKSAVDPDLDNSMGLALAFQEHTKAFLELQKEYTEWEVLDASDETVILKTFSEEASAEEDGPILFALTKFGFAQIELPRKIEIFNGINCRDLKYDADEMESLSSVSFFDLEKGMSALCTENLAKNFNKGRVFLRKTDSISRYDLATKTVKNYDMSSLFSKNWQGKAFINSFKHFSDDILVASVIYIKKGSWLEEKSFLVKDDKLPSFVELSDRPVHFFSQESFLACVNSDEEDGFYEELTLIDLKKKTQEKVFDTSINLYGVKAVEGLDLNLLNDNSYGCSDRASVISKSGSMVMIADKYYTQKAKYPLNEDLNLNITVFKAIDLLKVDYKRFCGLSPYEQFPFVYPVMNKESNYNKFCGPDGILIKSPNPVYDKPKELFLAE